MNFTQFFLIEMHASHILKMYSCCVTLIFFQLFSYLVTLFMSSSSHQSHFLVIHQLCQSTHRVRNLIPNLEKRMLEGIPSLNLFSIRNSHMILSYLKFCIICNDITKLCCCVRFDDDLSFLLISKTKISRGMPLLFSKFDVQLLE